jgi:hypothetical protein
VCAAALLAIALPALIFLGGRLETPPEDRMKGDATSTELRVYLKTGNTERMLEDRALVRGGNTIQLAYSVDGELRDGSTGVPLARPSPAVSAAFPRERYGVIFSIDGRSAVTLHFPYSPRQSTRLTLGKRVPLEEAYTLDDAPDFEIFFFVVHDEALDPRAVLTLAEQLARNPAAAVAQSGMVFWNYEVKTFTLRKE